MVSWNLERLLGVRLEMLENGFVEVPGTTLGPKSGNASKWPPGSFLERLLGLALEML